MAKLRGRWTTKFGDERQNIEKTVENQRAGGRRMTLNLTVNAARDELKPRITVFGVGGAGGNAVNNMIDKNLEGAEFVVANTDAQVSTGRP